MPQQHDAVVVADHGQAADLSPCNEAVTADTDNSGRQVLSIRPFVATAFGPTDRAWTHLMCGQVHYR